jgi:hypothetical protein
MFERMTLGGALVLGAVLSCSSDAVRAACAAMTASNA